MTEEELEKEIKNYIDKNCKQWETDGLTVDDIVRIAVLDFAEPREKRIADLEKENADLEEQLESERDLPTIAYMQGAEKQKKKDEEELKKWKDEWQEQVQKAIDEGYARTLQTIQLTKAKEYIKLLLMNCVGVYESTGKTIAEIQAEAEQFISEVEKVK